MIQQGFNFGDDVSKRVAIGVTLDCVRQFLDSAKNDIVVADPNLHNQKTDGIVWRQIAWG